MTAAKAWGFLVYSSVPTFMRESNRGQAQTFVLISAGVLLIVGALLFMLLNGAITQLLDMGLAVSNNSDSTTGISYVRTAWRAFPLIVLAFFLFSLLVGAVYSSDVNSM